MKRLVLSLLRIGDFLQQVPLLEQMHRDGEYVHVLVNDSLKGLMPLFPHFRFHFFPRSDFQKSLVRPEVSLVRTLAFAEEWVERLRNERFDVIENWTHNFLSARLMDLLRAPRKIGAQYQDGHLLRGAKRLRYMNESWGPGSRTSFTWADALALMTEREFPELETAESRAHGRILLQPLTSDAKKNWGLAAWRELSQRLIHRGYEVSVLAAPFEVEGLRAAGFPAGVSVLNLDLVELASELSRARLLVSGDTSVLHLGALMRTPLLGLFLGSAQPAKTAPRLAGARLLWARVGCSPCRHRDDCSQKRHVCAEELKVETVEKEVTHMMELTPTPTLPSEIERLEIKGGPTGAALVAAPDAKLAQWAQIVWDFYLNLDHQNPVAPYGSTARVLLQNWTDDREVRAWIIGMKERLDLSLTLIQGLNEALLAQMREFNRDLRLTGAASDRFKHEASRLLQLWKETDFVSRLLEEQVSSDENPFLFLKHRKDSLQEVLDLFNVQKNLLRVVEQEAKERGIQYGARA